MTFAAVLIAALAAASGQLGNTSNQLDDESLITVQERFSGIVCTGVCTDSELTVKHDGLVELRVRSINRPWTTHRFRVSSGQIRSFWRAYAAIRPPRGIKGPIGACDVETAVVDFEVHWNESFGSATLLACRDPEVAKAYRKGFSILRISPTTGERLSAWEAEALR